MGIAAAVTVSGDAEQGAQIARDATNYNYLTHKEVKESLDKQAECKTEACKNQIREEYAELDERRNQQLASICQDSPMQCEAIANQLTADRPKLLELSREAAKNGDVGALAVILYVAESSNQDAQNRIATELAALKGGDSERFLAQLGTTLLGAVTGGGAKGNSVTKALTGITQKQLDKKFKHASDFGVVTTKKNPETLAQYESAIKDHMASASTAQQGTYGFVKGSKVFFNSANNNAVVLDSSGNFVTGFKLSPGTQQFDNFIKNGVLR